jgi:hypothetical protein
LAESLARELGVFKDELEIVLGGLWGNTPS